MRNPRPKRPPELQEVLMQDQEASRTQTIEPSAVAPMNLDRLSEALVSGLAATIDWELLLIQGENRAQESP